MKIKFIIIFIFFIPITLNGMVIVDATRITQFVAKLTSIIDKLEYHNKKFAQYLKYNKFFNYNFFNTIKSVPDSIIAELNSQSYIATINILTSSGFYTNLGGKDIWIDIYKNPRKLEQKFDFLNDNSYITENTLYKKNPYWRKYLDENIKANEDYKKDLKNRIELLSYLRSLDTKKGEQFKIYKEFIDNAVINKTSANTARLMIMMANMEYEELLQQMQMFVLLRSTVETMIKKEVIAADTRKRYLKASKKRDFSILGEIKK
jgi:hypothetical protein